VITLEELNVVNTRLGGHSITLEGVRRLIKQRQDGGAVENQDQVTICEIGCGGGDNLFAINKKYAKKIGGLQFIGIDLNPECIAYARQRYAQLPCEWVCSDYAAVDFKNGKPDIIFSSLFCHHFTDEQLEFMLSWLIKNSRTGFFINDLHRHWLAYYLIKYITKFFSKSYLVRNDACISVSRGFKKKEWEKLFSDAGLNAYFIKWRWAFRHLVLWKNGQTA
jgi:2-polyprenyl-3-methyl-5-hydroxy-6-metoxy-1,4-benzoquinol methylase